MGIGKHLLGLAAVAAALALTGLLVWYGLFRVDGADSGPNGTLVREQREIDRGGEDSSRQAIVLGPAVLREQEAYVTAPDFLVVEHPL